MLISSGRHILLLVSVVFCVSVFSFKDIHAQSSSSVDLSPRSVLVKFLPGTPGADRSAAHAAAGTRELRSIPIIEVSIASVQTASIDQAINAYRRNPIVQFAEPNHRRLLYRPATDEGTENPSAQIGVIENFEQQWNLHNTGQAFGLTADPMFGTLFYPSYQAVADADINAPGGWSVSEGSNAVTIAILDSGVACTHLDLIGKCVEETSYVTSAYGVDDALGHGSHVAGIAAASVNNGIGIAGVGWNTTVASLKVCSEDESLAILGIVFSVCEDGDVAEAIIDAANAGYQVINMSLAGSQDVDISTLTAAVEYAWNNNAVLVAAAGNSYSSVLQYPAALEQVIAVGSTDYVDNLSGFSSFGSWVSVLAPGTAVLSTVPGGFCGQAAGVASDCYDTKSGTSMSAPHVAGLAALLIARDPTLSNAEVRQIIESSAASTGAMQQNMSAWSQHGRIDMAAALNSTGGGGGGGSSATEVMVQGIALDTVGIGRNRVAGRAQFSLVDDQGSPVSGAIVTGTFSAPFDTAAVVSDSTDNTGMATLTSIDATRKLDSYRFCVLDIVAGQLVYQPATSTSDCETYLP